VDCLCHAKRIIAGVQQERKHRGIQFVADEPLRLRLRPVLWGWGWGWGEGGHQGENFAEAVAARVSGTLWTVKISELKGGLSLPLNILQ
jgi:hypothetical protein